MRSVVKIIFSNKGIFLKFDYYVMTVFELKSSDSKS